LTVTVTFAQGQLALDASSQDHDAAIAAPALKAQAAILALPARTGILPILLAHRSLDVADRYAGIDQATGLKRQRRSAKASDTI
jgi:hypothetical protein